MAIATAWMNFIPSICFQSYLWIPYPLLATAKESESENGAMVLAGVLLSLIVIYVASKLGGEICARINLPPVLGELVGGVVIGVSAFQLLVFPESGSQVSDSVIHDLSPDNL